MRRVPAGVPRKRSYYEITGPMMVKLKIDNREIKAEPGEVLIKVIRGCGVEVPSMCYLKDMDHFTSCMICVVKERSSGRLIPSCSRNVEEGMDIITMDEEVKKRIDDMLAVIGGGGRIGKLHIPFRSLVWGRPTRRE